MFPDTYVLLGLNVFFAWPVITKIFVKKHQLLGKDDYSEHVNPVSDDCVRPGYSP